MCVHFYNMPVDGSTTEAHITAITKIENVHLKGEQQLNFRSI